MGILSNLFRSRDHPVTDSTNGSKEKATDHPLYALLHDESNPEMTSFVFQETLMTHLLLWGKDPF